MALRTGLNSSDALERRQSRSHRLNCFVGRNAHVDRRRGWKSDCDSKRLQFRAVTCVSVNFSVVLALAALRSKGVGGVQLQLQTGPSRKHRH